MGAQVSRHATAELPDELFALIVAKLPLLCIFQLRLVCRKWNAIFRNARFLEQYSQSPGLTPLYLWHTPEGKYAAYHFQKNSWHILPKPFISMRSSWNLLHGGANGCVLVSAREGSESAAYLVNPMTRSYEKLPKTITDMVVHLVVFDENSKSHKIFVGKERNRCSMSFFMYDTRLRNWTHFGDGENHRMRYGLLTIHRGILHCLATELDANPGVWKVFRCEGGQSWHQLTAAQVPCDLLFAHMFVWKGNLMLVGGRRMNDRKRSLASVEVWQLNEGENVWIGSMRMPDDLLQSFNTMRQNSLQVHNNNSVQVHSDGDRLFLCRTPSSRSVQLMVCNLLKNTWGEAPELPTNIKKPCKRFVCNSFVFKPNSAATYGNIIV